jgi:serine/threonine protein kinase
MSSIIEKTPPSATLNFSDRFQKEIVPFLKDTYTLEQKNRILNCIRECFREDRSYHFLDLSPIKFHFSCCLKSSRAVLIFEIFHKMWKAEGTYKKISLADVFEIEGSRITYLSGVLVELRHVFTGTHVIEGMDLLEKLHLKKTDEIRLASPLKMAAHPFYYQEFYEKNLAEASPKELFQCFQDVALSIQWLQTQKVAHTDLREDNVFLKREDGVLRAYVADFDFMTYYGYRFTSFDPKKSPYEVWDPCLQLSSIVNPLSDRFSFLRMVLRSRKHVKKVTLHLRDQLIEDFKNNSLKTPPSYHQFIFNCKTKELSNYDIYLYNIFYNIVIQSCYLMRALEEESGFPVRIKEDLICERIEKVKKNYGYLCEMEEILNLIK